MNAEALPAGVEARFVLRPGRTTIGRDAHADWTLPDPTRLVSSIHCTVEVEGGEARLTDASRNGTLLDGAPIRGTATLAHGAVLTIGPYRIEVVEGDRAEPSLPGAARPSVEADAALRGLLGAAADAMRAAGPALEALDHDAPLPPRDAARTADALAREGSVALEPFEAALGDLADHERALLPAVQTALFRLLNELSPHAVEDEVGGLNADARRWREYRERWERLATETENGMLDPFMAYLAEAYREERDELRSGGGSPVESTF